MNSDSHLMVKKVKADYDATSISLQLTCVLLLFNLYNPVSQIFGIEHNRNVYVAYSVVLAMFAVISWVGCFAKRAKCSSFGLAAVLLVSAMSGIAFAIWQFGWYQSNTVVNFCQFFIVFALPSMLAGMCLYTVERAKSLIKWFDPVSVALILCAAVYVLSGSNTSTTESGVGHQEGSYSAALALGIVLYFIIFKVENCRFKFTQTKIYSGIQYCLVPIALFLSIAGGGRGGTVLALTFVLSAIVIVFRKQGSANRAVKILIVTIVFGALAVLYLDPAIFEAGLARFMEIFASGALSDTSQAAINSISGRNALYQEAMSLILRSPVVGYGFFSYVNVAGFYPHNIVLEILLQGGLLYLILCIYAAVKAYYVWRKAITFDNSILMFMPIVMYLFIMFLFSGTYTYNATFWVLVGITVAQVRRGESVSYT